MSPDLIKNLTYREAELVRDSWELGVLPRYEHFGIDFFLRMFEANPNIKAKFVFLGNAPKEQLRKNMRLNKHANMAILLVGDSVASLGNEDAATQVRTRLRLLGRLHCKLGTLAEYFPVAKECLLAVVKEGFKSLWNKEMDAAWIKALDIVIGEMTAGLTEGYATAETNTSP